MLLISQVHNLSGRQVLGEEKTLLTGLRDGQTSVSFLLIPTSCRLCGTDSGPEKIVTPFIKPKPFLEVRVHDLGQQPSLTGLCVGYEGEKWRATQFAQHVLEWLPEFVFNYTELNSMNSGNVVPMLRNAAKKVYQSEKFKNRGEFGELFLHAAIRQVFESVPAISKIYYKSARNETVKGFDAVHVVEKDHELQLWLGEAKFFSDINSAIKSVVGELQQHTERNYLRDEFLMLRGKIDRTWKYAEQLEDLLSENKSLDEVFKKACIAVLLTYDSDCLSQHKTCDNNYEQAYEEEIRKHYQTFANSELPKQIEIHLFLLPLHTKEILIQCLDEKLKSWQAI
jgi:hypothetical protein